MLTIFWGFEALTLEVLSADASPERFKGLSLIIVTGLPCEPTEYERIGRRKFNLGNMI